MIYQEIKDTELRRIVGGRCEQKRFMEILGCMTARFMSWAGQGTDGGGSFCGQSARSCAQSP